MGRVKGALMPVGFVPCCGTLAMDIHSGDDRFFHWNEEQGKWFACCAIPGPWAWGELAACPYCGTRLTGDNGAELPAKSDWPPMPPLPAGFEPCCEAFRGSLLQGSIYWNEGARLWFGPPLHAPGARGPIYYCPHCMTELAQCWDGWVGPKDTDEDRAHLRKLRALAVDVVWKARIGGEGVPPETCAALKAIAECHR